MPSLSGYNKIVLKAGYTDGGAEHEEGKLIGAATPGMNLAMADIPESMQRHVYKADGTDHVGTGTGTTTSKNPILILKENFSMGKTIDDAYADNENMFFHICKPGDVIQVLVASGQVVTKLSGLSAGSNGKWTVDTTNAAVQCLEDSDGALAADTHVRCRCL